MIGAFMIIKNGIRLGYPFVEAILSVEPYVKDILVVDGFSTDGTFETLKQMNEKFPKVHVLQTPWGESKTGSVLAQQTNFAKQLCMEPWLLYVQADEVWHPESAQILQTLPARYPGILGFEFLFAHLSFFKWINYNPAYHHAVRLIKNIPEIKSEHDAWTFTLLPKEKKQVNTPFPIYHCGSASPFNTLQKHINHAKLYPDLPAYVDAGKQAETMLKQENLEIKKPSGEFWKENPFPLPEILKPLVGCKIYEPRDKLIK